MGKGARPRAQSVPPPDRLLSRQEFRELALARDKERCVVCAAPAVDVHHIVARREFPDGGYYLGNAASLCAEHHLAAERGVISAQELYALTKIAHPVLPPER